MRLKESEWELMSNTKEEWIKVGMVLGMMLGGMPGDKTEKI